MTTEMADGSDRSPQDTAALIQEMDHRIKNHLQLLASYARLASQRRGLTACELAADLADKLSAIAGAHDALHRSAGLRAAPALPFLCTLIAAFPQAPHPILVTCDAELMLPAGELAPIGMIVTEAVANALKHAFPGDMPGCVRVSLVESAQGLQLTVQDNGVGLAELEDARISGQRLIEALGRKLGGRSWTRNLPEGGAEVGLICPRRPPQGAGPIA